VGSVLLLVHSRVPGFPLGFSGVRVVARRFSFLCCVFCFVRLCLVCCVPNVSLDCPFLIGPSVFSNVYLPVSLVCPFLIAPSVFSTVYVVS